MNVRSQLGVQCFDIWSSNLNKQPTPPPEPQPPLPRHLGWLFVWYSICSCYFRAEVGLWIQTQDAKVSFKRFVEKQPVLNIEQV